MLLLRLSAPPPRLLENCEVRVDRNASSISFVCDFMTISAIVSLSFAIGRFAFASSFFFVSSRSLAVASAAMQNGWPLVFFELLPRRLLKLLFPPRLFPRPPPLLLFVTPLATRSNKPPRQVAFVVSAAFAFWITATCSGERNGDNLFSRNSAVFKLVI